MADAEGRYDGNEDAFDAYDGSPPHHSQKRSPPGFDDLGDSKAKYDSHGRQREQSKSRDRGREKDRDRTRGGERGIMRDRGRDRDRDFGHHRRDNGNRSDRREYGRGRSDERGYHRGSYDRRREGRQRNRSKSPSRGESHHRSRSRSPSQSKSKRISGFDMAPPATAMAPAAAAATTAGSVLGISPAIPGMFQNMAMVPGQFSTISVMPIHAMTQQATRHARRVYVGGLSPTANEQTVATYFSQVMSAIGGNTAGPGDAVVNVYINHEKKFAFVEMRSVEEASNAMALDGIIFEGAPVKVRRPSDYNPSLAAALGPSQPNPNLNLAAVGLSPGSAGGLEGPDRIFVGGLPYYFTETQIRELLESFGPLRGFDLVKDRETGNSKGYAFCVYQDIAVTDIACAALNGIKMGDKTLTVRRANQNTTQTRPEQESVLLHVQQQATLQRLLYQASSLPTKVVSLTNVVTVEELGDDEEYEDIVEDMRGEGGKFGNLLTVIIPRPNPSGEPTPGVGKVFLEYDDTDGAGKARLALHGRKFGGNQVTASFYPENKFAEGDYDG